jgi:hypothetical protein
LLASLFVFLHLQPSLLFANTTPAGGDLGAHAIGPAFVRGHLLGQGFFSGWSGMWWGGFPAFRYYMSLPTFFAALFSVVLPLNVALKVAVALPLVAMPLVVHRLVRSFGLPSFAGALGAVASLIFLFDSQNLKFGGNIASTIVGEYAYTYGLVFGLLAIASLNRMLADRGRLMGAGAGVLFGLAAACHPVALIFTALAIVVRIAFELTTDRRRALRFGAETVVLGGLVSAYWYIPVLFDRDYFNDLGNVRDTKFGSLLFGMPVIVTLLVLALAVTAVVQAIVRRDTAVMSFATFIVLMGFAVLIAPNGIIWNARLSPIWQLGLLVLAAVGAYEGITWIQLTEWQDVATTAGVLVVVGLVIAWNMASLPLGTSTTTRQGALTFTSKYRWLVGPKVTPNGARDIVTGAFGGYERGPNWDSYVRLQHALEQQVDEHGCGRVMAEFDPSGRFGSTYAIPMIPFFAKSSCLSSVMGFYTESSPTAPVALVAESAVSPVFSAYMPGLPYEQVDLDRGVQYLRELGAGYYVAVSPELRQAAEQTKGLRKVASDKEWELFAVDGARLVEPLEVEPSTTRATGGKEWQEAALDWFTAADSGVPRRSPDPPADWKVGGTKVSVSDLSVGANGITFKVSHPGSPVLVRENYFPTWKAIGASGPYRVTPNWMVVIPSGTTVHLEQQAHTLPWVASALTILGLIAAAGIEIRRHLASRPTEPEAT